MSSVGGSESIVGEQLSVIGEEVIGFRCQGKFRKFELRISKFEIY